MQSASYLHVYRASGQILQQFLMQLRGSVYFQILAVLLLVGSSHFISVTSLQAETLSKYGIDFAIESLAEVSANAVKVSVNGKQDIVSKDSVERHVITRSFEIDHLSTYTSSELFNFVKGALQERDYAYAGLGLEAFLSSKDNSSLEKLEEYEQLRSSIELEQRVELGKLILESSTALHNYPDLAAIFIFDVGIVDARWTRSFAQRFIYSNAAQIRARIKREFGLSLANKDLKLALRISRLLGDLFGSEDSDYRNLRILQEQVNALMQEIETGQSRALQTFRTLITNSSIYKQELVGIFLGLTYQLSENLNKSGKPIESLILLSYIEPQWRTPKAHELVLTALHQAPVGDPALLAGAVAEFVEFVASKDSRVREALGEFFAGSFRRYLANGELVRAEDIFKKIVWVRPDPNQENDQLRLAYALALTRGGMRDQAFQKVLEIRTGIKIKQHFELFLAGFYSSPALILGLLLIPIILLFWIYLRLKYNKRRAENADVLTEDIDEPIFTALSGKGKDPVLYQYERCLEIFMLDKDADIKQIKSAYRSSVKSVHPDINPDQNDEERARFIKLTETYEQMLKLRKRLGMLDE